jgi:hypothetical protein
LRKNRGRPSFRDRRDHQLPDGTVIWDLPDRVCSAGATNVFGGLMILSGIGSTAGSTAPSFA